MGRRCRLPAPSPPGSRRAADATTWPPCSDVDREAGRDGAGNVLARLHLAARVLLAEAAPGGDRHVGAVQSLRRDLHLPDDPLVLAVELAVEHPAEPGAVLRPEHLRREPGGLARAQQDRQVVLLIGRHVDLEGGPAALLHQQPARQLDADPYRAAPALLPEPRRLRPAAQ